MSDMSKYIKGEEMPMFGQVPIDIEAVRRDWSHLWVVLRRRTNGKCLLVKYSSIRSSSTKLKIEISLADAQALIERLVLSEYPDPFFVRWSAYRRGSDHLKIEEYAARRTYKQ